MTVFSVQFYSASGAEANEAVANPIATNPEPQQWIWPLTPAAGGAVSPSRIGFFGQEGHGDSVLLHSWNNIIYIVDKDGDKAAPGYGGDSGMFVPIKYVDTSTAFMSGFMGNGWNWNLANRIPCESGTLFIRFTEPSGLIVQTLNSTFRSVVLDANDWATNISQGAGSGYLRIAALECSRSGDKYGSMDGDTGSTGDTSWSRIDDSAADNRLNLMDHNWTSLIHDFCVCLSIKPLQTGKIVNFGFLAVIEYV
jgi:hypothetical protein